MHPPVGFGEGCCNEKGRCLVNTTTCSAGTFSYLLLNDLIGSEPRRKEVGGLFLSVRFGLVAQNVFLRDKPVHSCLSFLVSL